MTTPSSTPSAGTPYGRTPTNPSSSPLPPPIGAPLPNAAQPSAAQWRPPVYGPPQWHAPTYPPSYGGAQLPPQIPQPGDDAPRRRRGRGLLVAATVAVLAAGGLAVGVETNRSTAISGAGRSVFAVPAITGNGSTGGSGSSTGGTGSGTSSNGTTSDTTATATAVQQVGVVDVDTVLKYQNAEAAGTGLVLTSAGEILTNNHVVDGATSITVTVVSTGATYTATVVGTDPTDDIAVLKLSGASGLQVAKTSDSAVTVGAAVTAVGNAGGRGGTPSAASGTVTALDQTITATDESGANAETLNGLIETDAAIQAGDSGGPLYNASNAVVGIDTAASSGRAATQGYAIPIATALGIAKQIESGTSSSTIHQGYPAFLGISVSPTAGTGTAAAGAAIVGVLSGGPADQAGLTAGDTITSVGGDAVASATDLTTVMENFRPGQSVSVTWTDSAGASHTATVTLIQGPAN